MISIVQATDPESIAKAKKLFTAYAQSLDFDLEFQNFDKEMQDFPGHYAPPSGALLLALNGDQAVGCVALRPIDNTTCEMKRLYVKEGSRGLHAGRKLVGTVIDTARHLGYAAMRLDTLPSMARANSLYKAAGFAPIAPYRYNPIKGALFLELSLALPPGEA